MALLMAKSIDNVIMELLNGKLECQRIFRYFHNNTKEVQDESF